MSVHFRRQSASAILMVSMLFTGSALQTSEEAIAGHTDEALLVAALNDISGGAVDRAQIHVEEVPGCNATFRLARLVYSDILLAHSGSVPGVDAAAQDLLQETGLRDEAPEEIST